MEPNHPPFPFGDIATSVSDSHTRPSWSCRNHLLNEKFYIVFWIAKIMIAPQKSNRGIFMINIACHNVHWNISSGFIRHIHQITEKLLE